MCNFPAAPSPQRRTPRAVFQTPFVSNHPFSQINSEAHKVMLHPPSPLMTGATFKCKQLPFDSPDVTLVQEGDLQLQRRTGWFWQRRVFKEKHPEHKTWKVAHLRDPSSNSFFYYGQKQTGCRGYQCSNDHDWIYQMFIQNMQCIACADESQPIQIQSPHTMCDGL